MKNSVKQERSKNDLEAWLLNTYESMKDNREKTMRIICLILVFCLVFVGVRYYLNRDNASTQAQMDEAYYISTNQSLLAPNAAPDPAPFEGLAKTVNSGPDGLVARISAGEAYMKAGVAAISQRSLPEEPADEKAPKPPVVDPATVLATAKDQLTEVTKALSVKNNDLVARANYDLGVVMEQIAGISKGEEAVKKSLDQAAEYYEVVVRQFADSPYAAPARDNLNTLKKPLTVAYYNKIAAAYHTPKKPVESILPPGGVTPPNPADPNAFKAVDQFALEAKKDNVKKDEPKKDQPKKEEVKKDETKKPEPPKADPKKEEVKKDEPKKDEPKK